MESGDALLAGSYIGNTKRTFKKRGLTTRRKSTMSQHLDNFSIAKTPPKKKNMRPAYLKMQIVKSYYMQIVSTIFSSFSLLFVKILNHSHQIDQHSTNTIIFFLGFYKIFFSILFMKFDHIDITLRKNFNKMEVDQLFIRGIFEFLALLFTVLALSNMRLVSAITVIYLSPIITTYIIIKQKMDNVKKVDKICYFLSLVVVVIFIVQDFSFGEFEDDPFDDSLIGTLYAVIAGVLVALSHIMESKTCHDFHPYVILSVTGFFGIIFPPIFMSICSDTFHMNVANFTLFFLCGISCFFGFYFTHKSIEVHSFLNNTSLNYVTIVLAYVYSFLVLDEPLTPSDFVASLLSLIVNYYTQIRLEDCENEDNL